MRKYNVKSYELPRDVAEYVKACRIKKLAAFGGILLFCIVLMTYYRADIFPFWLSWRRGILFAVLVLAPFVFTGVPFCFMDSNWRGEVIDINYFTAGSIWAGASAGKSSVRMGTKSIVYRTSDSKKIGYSARYTLAVTVKKSDGSIKREKVSTFGGTISNYKIGDTVIHFKGLRELLIISKQDDGILNCVVCGCNNPKTREDCFSCKHTLLKDYDLTEEDKRYNY